MWGWWGYDSWFGICEGMGWDGVGMLVWGFCCGGEEERGKDRSATLPPFFLGTKREMRLARKARRIDILC